MSKQKPIKFFDSEHIKTHGVVLGIEGIAGTISSVIAALLCIPVTKLVCDRIFAVMGAVAGIDYDIRPVEVFVAYPLIMAAVVIPAAFLTSLYMRTINSESMGNIE